MKKNDFEAIYAGSFDDPAPWRRWFMDNVVDENDIYIEADSNGRAASALLLQPYDVGCYDTIIPGAYISCVATRPEARSKGLSSSLMRRVLNVAADRGIVMAAIIPASSSLYFFYKNFGFATVFYTDNERYTALHTFCAQAAEVTDPTYNIYSELEKSVSPVVLHNASQYENVLGDIARTEGSHTFAVRCDDGSRAVLFAVPAVDGSVDVRCLLSDSAEAAEAALAELRRRVGSLAITVRRVPSERGKRFLEPRGMLRICSAEPLLFALATSNKSLKMTIKLSDPIIAENNATFHLENGTCHRDENDTRRPDLDVSVDVLAAVLFSAPDTGLIFNLPTRRPYMSLMLD